MTKLRVVFVGSTLLLLLVAGSRFGTRRSIENHDLQLLSLGALLKRRNAIIVGKDLLMTRTATANLGTLVLGRQHLQLDALDTGFVVVLNTVAIDVVENKHVHIVGHAIT